MAHPLEAKHRDLELLGELCRWIARTDRSVRVGFRDAIPRLEVSTSGGLVVDVRVDDDGQVFVCRPSFERYPSSDIQAAAGALVQSVRTLDGGLGDRESGSGAGADE